MINMQHRPKPYYNENNLRLIPAGLSSNILTVLLLCNQSDLPEELKHLDCQYSLISPNLACLYDLHLHQVCKTPQLHSVSKARPQAPAAWIKLALASSWQVRDFKCYLLTKDIRWWRFEQAYRRELLDQDDQHCEIKGPCAKKILMSMYSSKTCWCLIEKWHSEYSGRTLWSSPQAAIKKPHAFNLFFSPLSPCCCQNWKRPCPSYPCRTIIAIKIWLS